MTENHIIRRGRNQYLNFHLSHPYFRNTIVTASNTYVQCICRSFTSIANKANFCICLNEILFIIYSSQIQDAFNLGGLAEKYLPMMSIRIHVDFVIFSFTIRSNAELRTVFNICACNPLKNPKRPSLFQIV